MKPYVAVTGVIFGLLAAAHVLRMILEKSHQTRTPGFVILTLVSMVLCAWAFRLLWSSRSK
jgi:dolichyl-phosphate-mannose--protein O-mannosyl transferase